MVFWGWITSCANLSPSPSILVNLEGVRRGILGTYNKPSIKRDDVGGVGHADVHVSLVMLEGMASRIAVFLSI